MTTALLGRPQTFGDTLRALSGSGAADLVHVGFPIGGEGYDFADFAGQASRFARDTGRSEEHTSELQSQSNLVCRLLLEKKKNKKVSHAQPAKHHVRPRTDH